MRDSGIPIRLVLRRAADNKAPVHTPLADRGLISDVANVAAPRRDGVPFVLTVANVRRDLVKGVQIGVFVKLNEGQIERKW